MLCTRIAESLTEGTVSGSYTLY